MPKLDLSESQCDNIASNILSDAELIKHGAVITPTGRLALVGSQLELVTLVATTGMDASMVDKSPPPAHTHSMDTWLDTGLDAACQGIGPSTMYRHFIRGGFLSRRDVLAAGRACVSKTRNVGTKYMNNVVKILVPNEYGLEWQEFPDPEYIARFCSRLSQVHSGALGLGRPTERTSVLDFLEAPLKERPLMLSSQAGSSYVSPEFYAETSNRPEVFAIRFELARQAMDLEEI